MCIGARKAVGEDAAFEVLGKGLSDVGLGGAVVALPVKLARAGQLEPGLIVISHRLVQQRALGVAGIVEFEFGEH